MPVTAAVLRELLRAGMTAEEMVEAAERIERDEVATKPRSAGAERTRRWRERHRDVTPSQASQPVTVTSQASQPVTVTSQASQPVTVTSQASQPVTVTSQASQPVTVTSQASQPVTVTSQASQPVTVTSQPVTGDAASRAEPQASTTYSSLEQKEEPQKENPPTGVKRKRVSDTGTRIPADWLEDGETAKAEGLSQQESTYEADRFRDYWCGIPGRHGRKVDWLATWRNWCRKAAEERSRGPRGQPDRPGGFAAVRADILSGGDLDDDGKDDNSGGESRGQGPDPSSDVLDLVAESIVHPQRD